ncbi:unnamed protein product [Schistosoma margrebowiei]|uniref:Uncharacterized protein n=1 Tax=Schistosoma margrebowiei TaxID=48269 RepID=A0A3P8DUZ2_9TREM|nr:unnamed protein product [Schistosoma margrebowiei]
MGNNGSVMPLDVWGHTCATMTVPTSLDTWPKGLEACADYVPALFTHCPSLLPTE